MLIKGIFTDVEINNQPPEYARHLKNVLLTEKLGTPINEPGFTIYVAGSAIPYTVNGIHVIDEAIVLWSTNGTNSEIGLAENGGYVKLLNDADFTDQTLGLSINAPVDAEHYVNFNSQRIVAWITDNNEPRLLNIDDISVQELNDIRIFPFSNSPTLNYDIQESGGGLEAGSHQIVISYANRNGLETNWGGAGIPINITDNAITTTSTSYDGVEPGFISAKAILINLSAVDTRFDFVKIGVIKTIDTIVTAQFIKSVPITGSSFVTIYTGTEGSIEDITLDEILVPSSSYINAKAIGQVNNKLYLGNLTVEEDIDLTQVALNTTLEWEAEMFSSVESLGEGYGGSKNPLNDTTFIPGEVMAFYLVGEKLDGSFTKGFHIPGREVDAGLDLIASTAAATAKFTDPPLAYEVGSTTKNEVLSDPITLGSISVNNKLTGAFGFWQNKNELYPTETVNTGEVTNSATYVGGFPDYVGGIPSGVLYVSFRVWSNTVEALGTPTQTPIAVARQYKRFRLDQPNSNSVGQEYAILQVIEGPEATSINSSGTAIDGDGESFLEMPYTADTADLIIGQTITLTGFGDDGNFVIATKSRTNRGSVQVITFESVWTGQNGQSGTVSWLGPTYFDCILDTTFNDFPTTLEYILPQSVTGLVQGFTGLATEAPDSPKQLTEEGLIVTIPTGTTVSELPQQGDTISATDFITGNGDYTIIKPSIIISSTEAGVFLEFPVDSRNAPTGVGNITYSSTSISGGGYPEGNVRHHRFPTLFDLRRLGPTEFQAAIGKSIMPKLRVKATNVVLNTEQQEKIASWFIVYAKRTPASATVMGMAPYQYAGLEQQTYNAAPVGGIGKEFVSHVANCGISNTNNVPTGSGEQTGRNFAERIIHQEVLKFNCFDLLVGKPSMGSLYIRNEIKFYDSNAYDTKDVDDLTTLDSGVYSNPSGTGNKLSRWIFQNIRDYATSATQDQHLLREISQYIYLPANIVDQSALGLGADLRMSEDSLWLKVRGGHPTEGIDNFTILPPTGNDAGIPALDIAINYNMPGNNDSNDTDNSDSSYLSTLCQRKEDVYLPFTAQPLIVCSNKVLNTETTGVFAGGDGRVNMVSLNQLAPYAAENPSEGSGAPDKFKQIYTNPTAFGEGLMGLKYFATYSVRNTGLRYTSNSDEATLYFPKILDFYNGIFDLIAGWNFRKILYSEDYTINNEYNAIAVFNPAAIPAATKLPHTLISSIVQGVEERTISWQSFLAADRYVMPRDKGPIINLQGVGSDRLFIHQRDSLFLTRSTTRLQGDIVDVTLGSGNMFSVVPAEVLSTDEGYGGTQHKFACKLTKIGYAFPDVAQGKIFLHNGTQLNEISKNGQRIFWRDNLNSELIDNPFNGEGMTIAYDEKYNRLLVGVKNGVTSFTASFSQATESWLGYHDYLPNYLIQTRKKLYSLNNGLEDIQYKGLFEHNIGFFGIYYNVVETTPIPYPTIIDIVYNPAPYEQKVFSAVEWASEIVQANGVQAKDETIDYITISNNSKTTGRVELERLTNMSQLHSNNTRNVNEFWRFNGLRDISVDGLPFRLDFYDDFAMIEGNLNYNKAWYRKAKFIDRFVITRYEYSNLYNNKFSFLSHDVNYRKSYR